MSNTIDVPQASDYGPGKFPYSDFFDEVYDAMRAAGGPSTKLYIVPASRVSATATAGYRQYAVDRRHGGQIGVPQVDNPPFVASTFVCSSGSDCPSGFVCGPALGATTLKTCKRNYPHTSDGLRQAMEQLLQTVPNPSNDKVHAYLMLRSPRGELLGEGLVTDDLEAVFQGARDEEQRQAAAEAAAQNVDPMILEWQRRLARDSTRTHRIYMLPLSPEVEYTLMQAQRNKEAGVAPPTASECVYARPVFSPTGAFVTLESVITQRTPLVCACQQTIEDLIYYGGFVFERVGLDTYRSWYRKRFQEDAPVSPTSNDTPTSESCPPTGGCPSKFAPSCSSPQGKCVARYTGIEEGPLALRDAIVDALRHFDTPKRPMAILYLPGTCGEPFDPTTDFYWDAAELVLDNLPEDYIDGYNRRGENNDTSNDTNNNNNNNNDEEEEEEETPTNNDTDTESGNGNGGDGGDGGGVVVSDGSSGSNASKAEDKKSPDAGVIIGIVVAVVAAVLIVVAVIAVVIRKKKSQSERVSAPTPTLIHGTRGQPGPY